MLKQFKSFVLALAIVFPGLAFADTSETLIGVWNFDVDRMVEVMLEQAKENGQEMPEEMVRNIFSQMVFELEMHDDGTYTVHQSQGPGMEPEVETGTWTLDETEDGEILTLVMDVEEGDEPEEDKVAVLVVIDEDHVSIQPVESEEEVFLVRAESE